MKNIFQYFHLSIIIYDIFKKAMQKSYPQVDFFRKKYFCAKFFEKNKIVKIFMIFISINIDTLHIFTL